MPSQQLPTFGVPRLTTTELPPEAGGLPAEAGGFPVGGVLAVCVGAVVAPLDLAAVGPAASECPEVAAALLVC